MASETSNRTELEIRLKDIEATLKSLGVEPLQRETSIDVPRATLREEEREKLVANPEGILPKRGSEIITHEGYVHPSVQILLQASQREFVSKYHHQRPETRLPIVKSPSQQSQSPPQAQPQSESLSYEIKSSAEGWSEPFSSQEGVMAPAPSPVKMATVPEAVSALSTMPLKSSNRILFIYPPNMDEDIVQRGLRAALGSVVRTADNLTICWAGGEEGMGVEPKSPGQEHLSSELMISEGPAVEVSSKIRQNASFIYNLLKLLPSEQQVQVKLEPRADVRWLAQQELQNSASTDNFFYDFVIMPCLPPRVGVNEDLEKFILAISPSPVILVRCPI